jgi:hypothetical protein
MGMLTSIPIDCWLCGLSYRVPAMLEMTPGVSRDVYTQQVAMGVWIHVEQTPIVDHLNSHWPVICLWFFMWRAFVDITGVDVFEYYQ